MRFAEPRNGKLPVMVRFELGLEELSTTLAYRACQEENPYSYINGSTRQDVVVVAMELLQVGGIGDYVHQNRSIEAKESIKTAAVQRIQYLFKGVS